MYKTILITGSTDGIGKLAAEQLAKKGHRIYVHGRNRTKLDQTIKAIKISSNNDEVSGFLANLSDFASIRSMINQVTNELDHIDVLINNAGVFHSQNPTNAKGIDMRFMVNYLAPIWLTGALMNLLQKGDGKVLNLSSAAQAPVDIEALKGRSVISVNESYAQSKLAITSWSFALSQQFPDIKATAVNPGSLLNTRMVREAYGHHWSSADKGADILVDLAVSPTPENFDGKYFDNDKGKLARAHPDAYDQVKVDELMKATEDLLKKQTG